MLSKLTLNLHPSASASRVSGIVDVVYHPHLWLSRLITSSFLSSVDSFQVTHHLMAALCGVTFILICRRLRHVLPLYSWGRASACKLIDSLSHPAKAPYHLFPPSLWLSVLLPLLLDADMFFPLATFKIVSHFRLLHSMHLIWCSVHILSLNW